MIRVFRVCLVFYCVYHLPCYIGRCRLLWLFSCFVYAVCLCVCARPRLCGHPQTTFYHPLYTICSELSFTPNPLGFFSTSENFLLMACRNSTRTFINMAWTQCGEPKTHWTWLRFILVRIRLHCHDKWNSGKNSGHRGKLDVNKSICTLSLYRTQNRCVVRSAQMTWCPQTEFPVSPKM